MSAVTHVIMHSLDVFLRKHFVRVQSTLTTVKYRAKPARMVCSRLLQIKNRHAEFISASHYMFTLE